MNAVNVVTDSVIDCFKQWKPQIKIGTGTAVPTTPPIAAPIVAPSRGPTLATVSIVPPITAFPTSFVLVYSSIPPETPSKPISAHLI